MKQLNLFIGLFLFFTITISAQKVTNVSNRQEQSNIIVSYDLETKTPCKIELFVSTNGGTTWQGPLKKVNGDVGANVSSGKKSITWSVLEEFEELSGENIVFKVSADASSTNSLATNSALKLIPKDAKSFKIRGEARFANKDYKGAIEDYTKAIVLSPKNAKLYELRGDAKDSLYRFTSPIKNGTSIKSDYSKAIVLNPNYDELYLKRGKWTIDDNSAIKEFNKAIALNSKNSVAYKLRANKYLNIEDYKNALNDLNMALKLNLENPDELLVLRARAKSNLYDSEGAINDLNQAISLNPKSEKGYRYRGLIKYTNDKEGAYDDFNMEINVSENQINKSYDIAQNRFDNKDFEGVLKYSTKSIELDSIQKTTTNSKKETYALLIRAAAYLNLNNINKAKDDYIKYINEANNLEEKLSRYEILIHLDRYALMSIGFYDLAIELVSLAIQETPNQSILYYLRGLNYSRLNKIKDAVKEFNIAIEKGRELKLSNELLSEYYFHRAIEKRDLNDLLGVISDITLAINGKPNTIIWDWYDMRANAKYWLNDYRGAILDYSKCIESFQYYESFLGRGDAKYKINDFKGAIADYTKVISLDPKNAEAFLWRGHAKIQIKDKIGACKDFSKAGELGEKDAYKAINANCN